MSRTYHHTKRWIDFEIDCRSKKNYHSTHTDGEDHEHLPFHERTRHDGTWRIKRGFFPWEILNFTAEKFVGKSFSDFHSHLCSQFHKNSMEGSYIRRKSRKPEDFLPYYYHLDENGLICRNIRTKPKFTHKRPDVYIESTSLDKRIIMVKLPDGNWYRLTLVYSTWSNRVRFIGKMVPSSVESSIRMLLPVENRWINWRVSIVSSYNWYVLRKDRVYKEIA